VIAEAFGNVEKQKEEIRIFSKLALDSEGSPLHYPRGQSRIDTYENVSQRSEKEELEKIDEAFEKNRPTTSYPLATGRHSQKSSQRDGLFSAQYA